MKLKSRSVAGLDFFMEGRPSISVVIISKNEEAHLARALESVSSIASELIIVDSFSEDRTPEIAQQFGAQFIQKEWMGYAATKNFANDQATSDMILSLDADECLSDELIHSIKEITNHQRAYSFNRRNFYAGKAIRFGGWYPDQKIRLFPRGKAHWQGDFVHERLVLADGLDVTHLRGDLLHYTYESAEEHRERERRYAQLAAQADQHKKANVVKALLKASWKFLNMYVFRLGVLDGKRGYQIASTAAKGKIWRYRFQKELNASDQL